MSQEKGAAPVQCMAVRHSDHTLTSGCASGVRGRRAARREETGIARSEGAAAIWPLHSAISIEYVRVTRRKFGAVAWQGIIPIHCSSDLEDCITFLVGFVRNAWPLGGQGDLSAFVSGAFVGSSPAGQLRTRRSTSST